MMRLLAVVILLLPACQGLKPLSVPHTVSSLDQARQAWQVLQREAPGSVPAQKALRNYDRAVVSVVRSLHGMEGTAAWGKEIQMNGWRVTFDASTGKGAARTWALSQFAQCRLASDVKLHGFDRVVAHDGLGVPVVLTQDDPRRVTEPYHPPHGEFLPATAVLEFPVQAPGQPAVARLRFYNPLAVTAMQVGPHSLPLAENLTAALQCSLTNELLDKDEPQQVAPSASGEKESQLFFLNRYDKTKVPVVFVHGLFSGPDIWKNMVNELLADPELRRRYQPMAFIYSSKLTIPESSARLRELLTRSRNQLDPGHHDAGFGHVVLVGHSMGGLLARMQSIDSGVDFWRAFFTKSPRKVAAEIDTKTQRMLRGALFFEREPDVKTVVFITTPHHGSVLADNSILRTVARLIIFLPMTAREHLKALTALPPAFIQPVLRAFHDWGQEGTENLSTKHPYFAALTKHPVGVTFHSIIATRHAVDFHQGSDGVVPYTSAHLDGAASETIVPYGHGCVEEPRAVQAVMKILKGVPANDEPFHARR